MRCHLRRDGRMHDETLAIHGGYAPDGYRAASVPIYQTVAHEFIDADHAGAIMDLEEKGFHYNRINNPTVDVLEQRLNALEGGAAAMAVSSGAAAVSQSVLNLLSAGDNFVSVPQLYGATYTYFAHVLPRTGIEVRFAADDQADSIAALIDEPYEGRLLRDGRQPGRKRRRPGGGGRRCPRAWRAGDRRQHRRDTAAAQADRARR